MGTTRARVVVRGRVQGVGFRYEAQARASSLGVGGWVTNRGDGSVEAVFEGRDDAVESMVAWCGRGPRGARVDDIEVEREQPQGDSEFTVR